jgi:signal transduction histidine kinase
MLQREAAGRRVTWALDSAQQLAAPHARPPEAGGGRGDAEAPAMPVGSPDRQMAEMHEPSARLGRSSTSWPVQPACVQADPDLTRRALGNLVGNAIRHGKARRC